MVFVNMLVFYESFAMLRMKLGWLASKSSTRISFNQYLLIALQFGTGVLLGYTCCRKGCTKLYVEETF